MQKLEVAEEWRLANSEWRMANGGSPAPAATATVAAIGDRGVATATLECGSAAAALSKGAQLPYDADSTRNRAGSAPVTRSGAALAVARSATDMQFRPAGTDVPTMSGLATMLLYAYDSMGNIRHKVAVSSGGATVIATYEYDPYGRLLYADPPPVYETAPQFLFSTKLYEAHWQHYYYGYRFYSPDLGRWLSRDPIGEGDGPNVYGFVKNTPLMSYDVLGLMGRPSGTRPCCNGRPYDPTTHCCCRTSTREYKLRRGKQDVGIWLSYYEGSSSGNNARPHHFLKWETKRSKSGTKTMGHSAQDSNVAISPDPIGTDESLPEYSGKIRHVSQKIDRCLYEVNKIKRCLNERADQLARKCEFGYGIGKCKEWAEKELKKCIERGKRTAPCN